ncbi:MAG: hypothetical protein ACI841_005166 [Planctomycetota bacterium]|jgi:hypothetical protein
MSIATCQLLRDSGRRYRVTWMLIILTGGVVSSSFGQGPTPTFTFSIEQTGVSVLATDLAADLLEPASGIPALGPLAAPITTYDSSTDLGLVAPGIGLPEVNALSFGNEELLPNAPLAPGTIYFSVDRAAQGSPASTVIPSVRSEGSLVSHFEASSDAFFNLGFTAAAPTLPGTEAKESLGTIDGNGLANFSGRAYPGVGLAEITPSTTLSPWEDIDALDAKGGDTTYPVYISLDPATAAANSTYTEADVIVVTAAGTHSIYALGTALGLNHPGESDDLDALILRENGVSGYDPSSNPYDWLSEGTPTDMLVFSVKLGSGAIGQTDDILGIPIEAGDLLIPPQTPGGRPGILIPAEHLGLSTTRDGAALGDELNAAGVAAGTFNDCNLNNIEDSVDLLLGTNQKLDDNNNGIPDGCDLDVRPHLNEVRLSHLALASPLGPGDTREFIEIWGPGGFSLNEYMVLVVEGDLEDDEGHLDSAWSLSGHSIPMGSEYFVIGDLTVPNVNLTPAGFDLEEGTQTLILIRANATPGSLPADHSEVIAKIGIDIDGNGDLEIKLPTLLEIICKIAIVDDGYPTDVVMNDPVIVGPDGSSTPPGIFCADDAANAWCQTQFLDNDVTGALQPETPGAMNGSCPGGATYCIAGANSVSLDGCRLTCLSGFGTSAAHIVGVNAPSNQPGLFYVGPNQIKSIFGNGYRCINGATNRSQVVISSGGSFSAFVDMSIADANNVQCWYRDPSGGGAGFNLSDALGP